MTDKQYERAVAKLYGKIAKAERALRSAQGEVVDLMAMTKHPRNKSRLDGAYDDIERARRKLGEVMMR